MRPKTNLPQRALDRLVLKVVVALESIDGYAIAQRLQLISRDLLQVQQGSWYSPRPRLTEEGHQLVDGENRPRLCEAVRLAMNASR
jgi:PadR family transcriptional regulator, regulatory protein PadR